MKRFKTSRPTRSQAPKSTSQSRVSGRISIGVHAVQEALNAHASWISEIWFKEGFGSTPQEKQILDQAQRSGVKPLKVPLKQLDGLTSGHQGIAAVLKKDPELSDSALDQKKSICLALDQVVDPHNLGAVVRTAWLFGVSALFTTKDRSAPITPTVSKVAQGGLEHVPIVATTVLDQELKSLKSKGFWIYGLSHKGTSSIYDLDLPDKIVWVLGAEGSGLRKPTERACDELVCIPQVSPEASFNVSVAAGIALAESHRQRGSFFLPKP